MAVMAGDLVTRLGVDGRGFQRGLQNARGEMRSFVGDVAKIASGLALFDVGKSVVGGVKDLAFASVNLAAEAETAAVQFSVLTGSAESAAAVMRDINKFAAETPFESMEITQAAKQLLAFGGSASSLVSELQTLGDLSAGMGIPLGELAEIYGKARIQGRLFMEDINQLQGRGINVTAELAKEFGNVRDAVEKGQVNFSHLEKALKAMTSEGGGFFGMMLKLSETFQGQLSTLTDNIKAIGRDLGAMVLPKLTEIVKEANKMLSAFNALGDARWKFLGDVLVASFDVAMETIKLHWADMLNGMIDQVTKINWAKLLNPFAGVNINDLRPDAKPENLQQAQGKLDGLMKQLKDNAAKNEADAAAAKMTPDEAVAAAMKQWNDVFAKGEAIAKDRKAAFERMQAAPAGSAELPRLIDEYDKLGKLSDSVSESIASARLAYESAVSTAESAKAGKAKEESQNKFTSGISSWLEGIKQSASGGMLSEISGAAQGVFDRAKIEAGAVKGMLGNWFGSADWDKEKQQAQQPPQLAGAMQQGSQEAYSTLVQNMLTRTTDPVVKATQEQTKQLIKAWQKNGRSEKRFELSMMPGGQ